METFVLAFVFMALVVAAMAVGVILGRDPIKGSCGGMGAVGIDAACDICGGDPKRCEEETRPAKADQSLFYDAVEPESTK